ncbi:peptidoglycan recognition protein family protein [Pleomorphomonas oryzae]|uniref:peptidoglycan recognition protein family protein n=1 Tax=Pleomorphomonas oryzae TaxID=261934 RepID=UPI000401F68F|nr:N-acetylmuramoyl-L-alanine amidase [Pleomorphomonas oryzae]
MSPHDIGRTWSSPNAGQRPPGSAIDHLVLHYTGMRSEEGARDWLCDPRSQVSSHYVVFEDGRIFQLVDESRRAWHAGRSFWRGVTDINSRSIGIEIANPGHEFGYRPFPDRQIEAVIGLCRSIFARHFVPPHQVVAHSDIAPDRKEDPGELFPWEWCAAFGIGLWVPPAPLDHETVFARGDEGGKILEFQKILSDIGFDAPLSGIFDDRTETIVRAFQRHWRPSCIDGRVDASTLDTLGRVAAAFDASRAA